MKREHVCGRFDTAEEAQAYKDSFGPDTGYEVIKVSELQKSRWVVTGYKVSAFDPIAVRRVRKPNRG